VELIVVITILAVLATIGFVSMTGYSQSARDSTRLANLKVVEKALVFHHTQNSIFPEPSDVQTVTFNNGGTINLWKTGNVGQSVIQKVKSLNEIPLDPSTNLPIEYSTTLN
jgi:type II secretory pathway pseudopilin PulG